MLKSSDLSCFLCTAEFVRDSAPLDSPASSKLLPWAWKPRRQYCIVTEPVWRPVGGDGGRLVPELRCSRQTEAPWMKPEHPDGGFYAPPREFCESPEP